MRVGVLTGGGDCPGLNAVIRAVVRRVERTYGGEIVGFLDGWAGAVSGASRMLDVEAMRGTLPRGGTVLGTSRSTPELFETGLIRAVAVCEQLELDGLVVVGGDGTMAAAHRFNQLGGHAVGVPKTIDNDIAGTDHTFGFNTAVQVATELIDRLHTTAEAHDRVMVVEVMGRYVGHVAVHAGLAGGATAILIPERPFDIDELCSRLRRRHARGRYASVVVVAEGARAMEGTLDATPRDDLDLWGRPVVGGIAAVVADAIEQRTGFDTRTTVLGHVQRGGTPTAYDRVLCSRFGVAAVDAIHDGRFGTMTALRGPRIDLVDLVDIVGRESPVDDALYETAATFFA